MADQTITLLMFLAFVAAVGVMIIVDARSHLRFSLRSFLVVMTFAAVVIALVAAYAKVVLTDK